MTWKRKI